MKKTFRILLIGAGVLMLLLAGVIMALFQPSVQTWLARKAVAGQPGMEISIGRVNAGTEKIELTDVRVIRDGMRVELPSALIEMPLLGVIREKVNIRKIVAKGWTVDLSKSEAAATQPEIKTNPGAGSEKPFSGLFDMLQLPVELTVDDADIEGVVILPPEAPAQPPSRANLSVRGGNLGAGKDGKFDLAAVLALADPSAPVSSIKIQSSLVARMDAPRTIQSLAFDADARASGGQLPEEARLNASITASRNASGEDYAVVLKSLAHAAEKNLVSIKAANPAGPAEMNAMWVLDLRDSDVSPFVRGVGLKLPAFTASGQGTVTADDSFQSIHAIGKMTVDVSQLEAIDAALSTLGRINVVSNFDITSKGDVIQVSALSADIASGAPVATVKALQVLEYNIATGEIKVPDIKADLVRADVHGLPLAWAEPFLKDMGLAVAGGPLRGSFAGKAQGNAWVVHSVAPLALAGVDVSQNGRTLAAGIDVSAGFSAEVNDARWSATVSGFSIQSHGQPLVEMPEAKAGGFFAVQGKVAQPVSFVGKARANLPALLAQPAAADFRVLAGGHADIDFSGHISDAVSEVAAKVAATGLLSKDNKELPKITVDVRADLHSDGHCEAQMPLVFELVGRKSDIDLTATVKPDGSRQSIDASVTSNELFVEDLMTLAALAPGESAAAPGQPPAQEDAGPPWNAIGGQIKFLLKKVVYSPDLQAGNISGAIKITPSLLSLENLKALTTDGAEVKADGTLKFDGQFSAAHYAADAKVAVSNFDPAPFFTAINPEKPPAVEGKFDVSGIATGTAATLAKLAGAIGADLTLTSRGGKFRGFAASALSSEVAAFQKMAASSSSQSSTIAAIGSAVLSLVGKNDNAAVIEKIRAGSRVISRLLEINFDQINLVTSYQPGRDIDIKDFTLLSPDMRLAGSGSLGNNPALGLLRQALTMNLQMAVRGEQADDLRLLNLLKKEADTLGFTPLMKDFSVEGTPASMLSSALMKQIITPLMAK